LKAPKQKKHHQDGKLLYLGGQVAERLYELNFWTLDLSYYEACIRSSPHSQLARTCFERWKTLTAQRMGDKFSEASDSARLAELNKLAQ
jgi:hypothetical protein